MEYYSFVYFSRNRAGVLDDMVPLFYFSQHLLLSIDTHRPILPVYLIVTASQALRSPQAPN